MKVTYWDEGRRVLYANRAATVALWALAPILSGLTWMWDAYAMVGLICTLIAAGALAFVTGVDPILAIHQICWLSVTVAALSAAVATFCWHADKFPRTVTVVDWFFNIDLRLWRRR